MPREFFHEDPFVYHYINALLRWLTPNNMRFKRVILETIVPRDAQKQYVQDRYGVESVPEDWHPETHYSFADWRPLTPSWPPTPRRFHWTSAGDWILHVERSCKPCQLCGARIIMETLIREPETCKQCPGAAAAFAMGTHARLGADSSILLLGSDLIGKIVSFV